MPRVGTLSAHLPTISTHVQLPGPWYGPVCTCLYVGITWAEVDLGAAVIGAKGVAGGVYAGHEPAWE